MRLLLTAFFLETGVVLVLAPWSEFWDRNYFVQGIAWLHAMAINNFVRGAISGVGLVNLGAAVAEMFSFFAHRRIDPQVITLSTPTAEE